MKFFALLFLSVAVTHAAFTRDLVEASAPLVSEIGSSIQNAVSEVNRASPSIQHLQQLFATLATHVQNNLTNTIAEIQSGLVLVQNFQNQVSNYVQQAAAQISVGADPQDVLSLLLQNLHGLVGRPQEKASFIAGLLAIPLGVPADSVDSLLGTVGWIVNLYGTLKPLIDALNIPVMLSGGLQSLINSDYMQWLIYEVAPAQLPQTAVDALNNFLSIYFGPTRTAVNPADKDIADYLQGMYQTIANAMGPQVAALQGHLQQLVQDAQQQSVQFLQQILQFVQQTFNLNAAQLGTLAAYVQAQIKTGQIKLKMLL